MGFFTFRIDEEGNKSKVRKRKKKGRWKQYTSIFFLNQTCKDRIKLVVQNVSCAVNEKVTYFVVVLVNSYLAETFYIYI